MPKKGYVGKSLGGLRALAVALAAMKAGRVDVGFFAGEAARSGGTAAQQKARSARTAAYIGAGSKPGFFKQGVEYDKRRRKLKGRGGEETPTNPELAAKNEFGIGVPRRSMLRMPLHLHGDKVLKGAQADARAQLAQVGRNPRAVAKKVLTRVGIAAENLVQEAFDTRGFGSWKPNAPETIALKGSDAPLIDSSQMRHAVDSRVVG